MDYEGLTDAERLLWEKSRRGAQVDLPGGEVRAEVIRALLLGASDREPDQVPAIRLLGAHITGPLDLSHAEVALPLFLTDCAFACPPDLTWARVRTIELTRCTLPGITAPYAQVEGSITLESCRFTGPADLSGARLAGHLDLRGTRLTGTGPHSALRANRVDVGGSLLGADGLIADGAILLNHARIAGDVDFSDAHLRNGGGAVLDLEHLNVEGSLICRRITTHGTIRLFAATVGGPLLFVDAHLNNPGKPVVLAEDGLTVGGSALFGSVVAKGEILMYRAKIGGMLAFGDAKLSNPGGTVLALDGLTVESMLFCAGTFTAEGRIRVGGSRIGAVFNLEGAQLSNPGGQALSCAGSTIDQLRLRPRAPIAGSVSLAHTSISRIDDDLSIWPEQLELDGLTYETLTTPGQATERLAWIARGEAEHHTPQPYEQLAAAYRRLGDDLAARQVLLTKQRRRRGSLPWYGKAWGYLQDATVGYGYRPLRAAAWLLTLLIVGTTAYSLHHPKPLEAGKGPGFSPAIYTLDLLLPIIDFGQERAFAPTGAQQWLANALVIVGWILATTIVAGLTRSLSRQ
ncbi:hypothetical protein ACSDR0_33190 [Streptosporangium sp. G11]|uniref:hypothetical protein n=1 Tax=Streptosporangium sp. G11 TaxID=3436926 RepID=UPI003EC0AD7B